MSLGDNIRRDRKSRGWSQVELAARSGVSRPTIARVERGDDVSIATVTKVATALGLDVVLQSSSAANVS